MKMREHVRLLLKQGRSPKELIELGFPKAVVTKVQRQLKTEKAALQPKTAKSRGDGKGQPQAPAGSAAQIATIEPKLASVESEIRELETRVEVLEATGTNVKDMEARLDNTPAVGLRYRFKCDCGASGLVALHIQCTKCGRETRWGWFPKQ